MVKRANAAFREYFDAIGAHESALFGGIHDALAAVAQSGARMSVVTHKPLPIAKIVIVQHALDVYIDGIYAPPSPRIAVPKEHLFAEALDEMNPRSVISVGDRGSDIIAAAADGIDGVGVTWGYGVLDELLSAGATSIAAAPAELPMLVCRPSTG